MNTLEDAICRGDKEAVKKLLANRIDIIRTINQYGNNFLILSAANNQPEITRLLIDGGIPVDMMSQDNGCYTALSWAAYLGHKNTVALLLEKGAALNTKNYAGSTALHMAAGSGHLEVVRLLIDKGADLDILNDQGDTAQMRAKNLGQQATAQILKNISDARAAVKAKAETEALEKALSTTRMLQKDMPLPQIIRIRKHP